jgi:hypothetical protein
LKCKVVSENFKLIGLTSIIFHPAFKEYFRPQRIKQLMQQRIETFASKTLNTMTKLILLTIFWKKFLHCLLGNLQELHVDHELPGLLVDSGQLGDLLLIVA